MTEHTYQLATRLRAIAADSLHTFQPGRRALTVEDLPEEIFVTARFATHPWGSSGYLGRGVATQALCATGLVVAWSTLVRCAGTRNGGRRRQVMSGRSTNR